MPNYFSRFVWIFLNSTSGYVCLLRHRWTGRYEAHLWDSSCKKEGQSRKGRQGQWRVCQFFVFCFSFHCLLLFQFLICGIPCHWLVLVLLRCVCHSQLPNNKTQCTLVSLLHSSTFKFLFFLVSFQNLKKKKKSHARIEVDLYDTPNWILLTGGYDREEKAARAYDLAALKYWGPSTHLNFTVIICSLFLSCSYISCHFFLRLWYFSPSFLVG